MSSFEVKARRLVVREHENADALELAQIEGTDYQAVVRKDEFKSGDIAVYIPEAALVPLPLLQEMGLEGALAGGDYGDDGKKIRNRVKAVRLRGALSQGLVCRPSGLELALDQDYAETLGISKWSPPIPISMSGKAEHNGAIRTYTDIENIKRWPDLLREGEEILAVEKLHGTCCVAGLVSDELFVSSKGIAAKHLVLSADGESVSENVYWRMAESHDLAGFLRFARERLALPASDSIHIYGETIGVQDLRYGLAPGELDFYAFDLRAGQDFLDYDRFQELCDEFGLQAAPILYRGPYSRHLVEQAASGPETIAGGKHVREGVVVRPVNERRDPELGRVILKVISPDYLLRKGEATEYE